MVQYGVKQGSYTRFKTNNYIWNRAMGVQVLCQAINKSQQENVI